MGSKVSYGTNPHHLRKPRLAYVLCVTRGRPLCQYDLRGPAKLDADIVVCSASTVVRRINRCRGVSDARMHHQFRHDGNQQQHGA